MRVTVVHNPNAGEGERGATIVAELSAARHDVTYVNSKKADLEEALEDPGDLVLVAGGDGTVRKVSMVMHGRDIPVVVVPLGTANNIAATLGVHDRPDHLAAYLETLRPMPFDIGLWTYKDEEIPFVESVGVGVLTDLMVELGDKKRSERVVDKERGFADELEVLMELVDEAKPVHVDLVADGKKLHEDYLLIEVMNIRSVGPNVILAPQADPADGFFDLVTVLESERDKLRSFIQATRQRKPVPELPRHRVREVKARCIGGTVHRDDQLIEDENSTFSITIEPGAITMLAPPSPNETDRRKRDRRTANRHR